MRHLLRLKKKNGVRVRITWKKWGQSKNNGVRVRPQFGTVSQNCLLTFKSYSDPNSTLTPIPKKLL